LPTEYILLQPQQLLRLLQSAEEVYLSISLLAAEAAAVLLMAVAAVVLVGLELGQQC
jgi:hypothetical protein